MGTRHKLRVEVHSSAHSYPVVPLPFVEKTISPTLNDLGTLDISWSEKWTFIYGLSALLHWFIGLSLCHLAHCLDDHSFVPNSEIRKYESFFHSVLFRVVLAIQDPLQSHMNFRIACQFLQRSQPRFRLGLHWISPSFWGILPF